MQGSRSLCKGRRIRRISFRGSYHSYKSSHRFFNYHWGNAHGHCAGLHFFFSLFSCRFGSSFVSCSLHFSSSKHTPLTPSNARWCSFLAMNGGIFLAVATMARTLRRVAEVGAT